MLPGGTIANKIAEKTPAEVLSLVQSMQNKSANILWSALDKSKALGQDAVDFLKKKVIRDNKKAGIDDVMPPRSMDDLLTNGTIPKAGFNEWFDDLSPEEFDLLWENEDLKTRMSGLIRNEGSVHEWCMVCKMPTFKGWGVSMDEVQRFVTKTSDLKWVNPANGKPGGHFIKDPITGDRTAPGSTTFHNLLKKLTDDSVDLPDFNRRLANLVDDWDVTPPLPPFPVN